MQSRFRRFLLFVGILIGLASIALAADPADLAKGFQTRPPRPGRGSIGSGSTATSPAKGITADLEAMRRVGIGGVLIMEVEQGTPPGPAAFAGPQWRELFQFMLAPKPTASAWRST